MKNRSENSPNDKCVQEFETTIIYLIYVKNHPNETLNKRIKLVFSFGTMFKGVFWKSQIFEANCFCRERDRAELSWFDERTLKE